MTEIAENRSWWTEVEHLRPGADVPAPGLVGHALAEPADAEQLAVAPVRRGRITGRPLPAVTAPADRPAVLRRADAAAFADAMDLDGAFGAPAQPARSREIVLTGQPAHSKAAAAYDEAEEHEHEDADASETVVEVQAHEVVVTHADAPVPPPAVRGQGRSDRKTVRITGRPGIDAELGERRALREIQPRRSRTASERLVHQPDRIAMWVVLLGLFLVIIAATSSSAGVA